MREIHAELPHINNVGEIFVCPSGASNDKHRMTPRENAKIYGIWT